MYRNYHKKSIQIDQTVFWKIRKTKTVTFLFILPFRPSQHTRGPRPAHARARASEIGPASRGPSARSGRVAPSPPRSGRNLGLGQDFGRAAAPAWAKRRPEPSWPLISDRRWSAQLGASKTPADRVSLSPSFIFTRTLSLFASLLSSVHHRATR